MPVPKSSKFTAEQRAELSQAVLAKGLVTPEVGQQIAEGKIRCGTVYRVSEEVEATEARKLAHVLHGQETAGKKLRLAKQTAELVQAQARDLQTASEAEKYTGSIPDLAWVVLETVMVPDVSTHEPVRVLRDWGKNRTLEFDQLEKACTRLVATGESTELIVCAVRHFGKKHSVRQSLETHGLCGPESEQDDTTAGGLALRVRMHEASGNKHVEVRSGFLVPFRRVFLEGAVDDSSLYVGATQKKNGELEAHLSSATPNKQSRSDGERIGCLSANDIVHEARARLHGGKGPVQASSAAGSVSDVKLSVTKLYEFQAMGNTSLAEQVAVKLIDNAHARRDAKPPVVTTESHTELHEYHAATLGLVHVLILIRAKLHLVDDPNYALPNPIDTIQSHEAWTWRAAARFSSDIWTIAARLAFQVPLDQNCDKKSDQDGLEVHDALKAGVKILFPSHDSQ